VYSIWFLTEGLDSLKGSWGADKPLDRASVGVSVMGDRYVGLHVEHL
jgi:hypothetical protein